MKNLAKKIIEYDKLSNECEIVISDGKYELLCYSYDYRSIKSKSKYELISFMANNIYLADRKEFEVKRIKSSYFSYEIHAQIISLSLPAVAIGRIKLMLDNNIPSDLSIGDFIVFSVDRVDFVLIKD